MTASLNPAKILRLQHVQQRTGLSRPTIRLWAKDGRFPPPISLGVRARGWIESEVDAWIQAHIKASRHAARMVSR